VVRFKCIYCGQRMLAQEDGRGRKGKCPKCNHLVVVPWTTKGRPAISPDKESMPDRPKPYVPPWDKDTHQMTPEQEGELIELFKESFGFLIPTYDKLSLFLMAVTLILLFVMNIEMRNSIQGFIHGFRTEPDKYHLPLIFYLIFICLCVYISRIIASHIVTSDERTDFKKKIMLFFAVLINAVSDIIAGIHVLKNAEVRYWQLVFPIWNIVNAVLLLLMLRFGIIDEECISDRKATLVQIILGLASVLIIFVFCNFVFKLYWAITFSICIIYTTSFDRALQSVFSPLSNQSDEQSS
jgi:DNA-directed RNA polymerase subunit RPC12/RpoP